MATTDISRSAFDPRKHYASVRMQQGRVLLDEDWNERERIASEAGRRTLTDIIGPRGTPDDGFGVANPAATGDALDFEVTPGTFYLGGIRLVLEQTESFRAQADWLQFTDESGRPRSGRVDLVYLEAWQQPVSAVEDSELLEAALGGPDTTTRIRNMRRVKVERDVGSTDCAEAWQQAAQRFQERGEGALAEAELESGARLTVALDPGVTSDDPCSPSFVGGYLGAENQAIRVQMVDGSSFTWGFDNGAPLYRVLVSSDRTTLTLETDPKDQAHWPLAGDVVEVLPWSAVLVNGEKLAEQRGFMTTVSASYNPDDGTLQLSSPLPSGFGEAWKDRPDSAALGDEYLYLRVWQRGSDRNTPPSLSFTPGTPVALGHTGLSVTLTGAPLRPGDYWIIAARPNSPDAVVPWELMTGRPANGVRLYRAPLALIQWSQQRRTMVPRLVADCRPHFLPLTQRETCATYTVGDGVHSHGHFQSIQQAVNALPLAGGEVHLLQGDYTEHVVIARRRNVTIRGCGPRTRVSAAEGSAEPVFRIRDCRDVALESFAIHTELGIGVQLEHAAGAEDTKTEPTRSPREVSLRLAEGEEVVGKLLARAGQPAMRDFSVISGGALKLDQSLQVVDRLERFTSLELLPQLRVAPPQGLEDITLRGLWIGVRDRSAVFGRGGAGISLINCEISVAPLAEDMSTESDAGRWPAVFLTSDDVVIKDSVVTVDGRAGARRTAFGGIQLGGGTDRARVEENTITGGNGNGITLGSILYVPPEQKDLPFADFTRFLQIGRLFPIGLVISVDERGCVRWTPTPPAPVDENGEELVPASEGSLSDIEIVGNRVTGTGGAGVGVAHFFDPTTTTDCVTVSRLSVRGNRIQGCLQGEVSDTPVSVRSFSGFGAIALAGVLGLELRENVIERNGLSHISPVCGVFVLYGEDVVVEDNRIVGNGPRVDTDAQPRAGNRGGVVIALASAPMPAGKGDAGAVLPGSPMPAARIHRNVVVAPEGRALMLTAMGDVSVQANHLTSLGHGVRGTHGALNEVASSGRLARGRLVAGSGVAAALADFAGGAAVSIKNYGMSFEVLLRRPGAASGEPSGEAAAGEGGAVAGKGDQPVAEAGNIAGAAGRLTMASMAAIAAKLPGQREGGNVLFSGNQVSFTAAPGDAEPPSSIVLITSSDDISMQDNQVEALVTPTVWFVNALVYGFSVRVSGNRFKEPLLSGGDRAYSAITFGQTLNVTTGNEGTHCFFVRGAAPRVTVQSGNVSLVELLQEGACAVLRDVQVTFGEAVAVPRGERESAAAAEAETTPQEVLRLLQ